MQPILKYKGRRGSLGEIQSHSHHESPSDISAVFPDKSRMTEEWTQKAFSKRRHHSHLLRWHHASHTAAQRLRTGTQGRWPTSKPPHCCFSKAQEDQKSRPGNLRDAERKWEQSPRWKLGHLSFKRIAEERGKCQEARFWQQLWFYSELCWLFNRKVQPKRTSISVSSECFQRSYSRNDSIFLN